MEIEIILDTGHAITVKTDRNQMHQIYADLLDDEFPFSFLSNAIISKHHIAAIVSTESMKAFHQD